MSVPTKFPLCDSADLWLNLRCENQQLGGDFQISSDLNVKVEFKLNKSRKQQSWLQFGLLYFLEQHLGTLRSSGEPPAATSPQSNSDQKQLIWIRGVGATWHVKCAGQGGDLFEHPWTKMRTWGCTRGVSVFSVLLCSSLFIKYVHQVWTRIYRLSFPYLLQIKDFV